MLIRNGSDKEFKDNDFDIVVINYSSSETQSIDYCSRS